MNDAILLVSTATQYIGTARIPGALAKAGFEVFLLTPRNSLAAKSRYVRRCGLLPDDASPMQWLAALARMVDVVAPRLVLPCDDNSVRLLQSLVLQAPAGFPAATGLALAVTGDRRVPSLPNTPTVAEQGYPGFDMVSWYGILAPHGTPSRIIGRLNADLVRIVHEPGIQRQIVDAGQQVVGNSSEEFAADIRAGLARGRALVDTLGIRVD